VSAENLLTIDFSLLVAALGIRIIHSHHFEEEDVEEEFIQKAEGQVLKDSQMESEAEVSSVRQGKDWKWTGLSGLTIVLVLLAITPILRPTSWTLSLTSYYPTDSVLSLCLARTLKL